MGSYRQARAKRYMSAIDARLEEFLALRVGKNLIIRYLLLLQSYSLTFVRCLVGKDVKRRLIGPINPSKLWHFLACLCNFRTTDRHAAYIGCKNTCGANGRQTFSNPTFHLGHLALKNNQAFPGTVLRSINEPYWPEGLIACIMGSGSQ